LYPQNSVDESALQSSRLTVQEPRSNAR